MILHRCFAWEAGKRHTDPDGALWFPRLFQGDGRHDNPDIYGCLYLSEHPISCVVEQFARFRGQRLTAPLLKRRGLPLALATLELTVSAALIDLDDPAVLKRQRLRPSQVATRQRAITRAQARTLHDQRPPVDGLRWWSIHESTWGNVTLFDRAGTHLRVHDVEVLTLQTAAVLEAVQFLGFQVR